jgi:hypothetical protein
MMMVQVKIAAECLSLLAVLVGAPFVAVAVQSASGAQTRMA